ncbi:hypothetical protein [Coleofasciculus sp. LEGE 07092]|uniref:hypothetical protein n=1 Tax=Coleofasciculus sp. LEGE 07092 TaxID=2777969 RepID=UPI00223FEF5C|nr:MULTISPECIES: hypothetical protein [unclassified Coleofasciculus]
MYGSSYIPSFLSWIICLAAEKQGYSVVSPALPNRNSGNAQSNCAAREPLLRRYPRNSRRF